MAPVISRGFDKRLNEGQGPPDQTYITPLLLPTRSRFLSKNGRPCVGSSNSWSSDLYECGDLARFLLPRSFSFWLSKRRSFGQPTWRASQWHRSNGRNQPRLASGLLRLLRSLKVSTAKTYRFCFAFRRYSLAQKYIRKISQ